MLNAIFPYRWLSQMLAGEARRTHPRGRIGRTGRRRRCKLPPEKVSGRTQSGASFISAIGRARLPVGAGKSAADGPAKRKANNPPSNSYNSKWKPNILYNDNVCFLRPDSERGFQGLPNGPIVPISENPTWRRTSQETLQRRPGIPRSGAHKQRYSVGNAPSPRDRIALRIARPGPLPSAPQNAQRDIIEAGKHQYAQPLHRILSAAPGGGVWPPPRRATAQGGPQADGARDSKARDRENAQGVGPDGALPGWGVSDSRLDCQQGQKASRSCLTAARVRPRGALSSELQFAPGLYRSLTSGAPKAHLKPPARLSAQVYAISALFSGFLAPCAYALTPSKTTETYATMRNTIRAQMGRKAADMGRLLAIDFEQDAINSASPAFPRMTPACCYFQLRRKFTATCVNTTSAGKRAPGPDFKIRVEMVSVIASLSGFEMMGPLFGDGDRDIAAYFGRTYVGQRAGAMRMRPMIRIDLRHVRNRMGAGDPRANNAAGSLSDGFPSGGRCGAPSAGLGIC